MNFLIPLFVFGIIWIIFAVVQDIRKREIANWLNYSLIIFVLGYRFFYSLFFSNYAFFYEGLIGLTLFFIISRLLYYGKLFAGGDANLMMALGAIIPFSLILSENIKLSLLFLLGFFFIGAIYSLLFSFVLSMKNSKKFKKIFFELYFKNKKLVYLSIFFGLFFILLSRGDFLVSLFGVFIIFFPYLYFHTKAVDIACMIKKIKVQELSEGDWLYRSVKIGSKTIEASWDGLTKKDIALLKKNKKFILVRQGIPFAPVFSFAFILFFILVQTNLWNSFW